MGKVSLIIQREYLSRVKKKSFIIMTLIGPILMAALFVVPIILAESQQEYKHVMVLDQSSLFLDSFEDRDDLNFTYLPPSTEVEDAKAMIDGEKNYGLLYIPLSETGNLAYLESAVQFYTKSQPSLSASNYIRRSMERDLQRMKLEAKGIDLDVIESVSYTHLTLPTIYSV